MILSRVATEDLAMLPLALALTLAAAPAALPPPETTLVVRIPERALCHDIDPNFVLYVEPARHAPGGNPLLWWIGGEAAPNDAASPNPRFDDRPAVKDPPSPYRRFLLRPPLAPPLPCARTIPAR